MEPEAYKSLGAYRHSVHVLYTRVGCRIKLHEHTIGRDRDWQIHLKGLFECRSAHS